jgi:hypothetical protein
MKGTPKKLVFPEVTGYQSSGIEIEYIKSRDVLRISGFYDLIVGIESTEMSVKDFCERLGIRVAVRREDEST